MKSMQELVLEQIAKTIEDHELTPVQNAVYGNQGSVYAMDGLQSVCKVTYDFQSGSCFMSVSPVRNVVDNPPIYRVEGDRIVWYALKYEEGDRIKTVLHELGHCIVGAKAEAARRPRLYRRPNTPPNQRST
jgi:hypothetical protein